MIMGKQHDTMPNEPQEAPVRPQQPEIRQPNDPKAPDIPQEAPQNEPQEVPRQPNPQPGIMPDQPGSEFNRAEV
jgi:hypothetical protein